MKALILAAGLGTRLRPLTDQTPKCLVPIGGRPLLSYHLDALQNIGVSDVLINTHYLSDQVESFLEQYRQGVRDMSIVTAYEESLLGSAGTLKMNQDFFKGEEDFLVVYGDDLTNLDYARLLKLHKQKKGICTIACYYEKHPEQKGVVIFDANGQITEFKEKPKKEEINTNDANAGIYVVNQEIFKMLAPMEKPLLDFGYDVFPPLLRENKAMFVYQMEEFFLDIGTPENYNFANSVIKDIRF